MQLSARINRSFLVIQLHRLQSFTCICIYCTAARQRLHRKACVDVPLTPARYKYLGDLRRRSGQSREPEMSVNKSLGPFKTHSRVTGNKPGSAPRGRFENTAQHLFMKRVVSVLIIKGVSH